MGSWLWHATTTDPHAITGEVRADLQADQQCTRLPNICCVLCDDSHSGMCRGYLTAGFGVVVGFLFFG